MKEGNPMKRTWLALLPLLAWLSVPAAQEDAGTQPPGGFTSLQEMMSPTEFVDAGLADLSKEQLDTLNAWLKHHVSSMAGATPGAAPYQPADNRGLTNTDEDIVSRIDGRFDGWDGHTTFKLQNGQVWEQAESVSLRGVHVNSPEVHISHGVLGWRLYVEGQNKSTAVRRVK